MIRKHRESPRVRYIVRVEENGFIREIGSGHSEDHEKDFAEKQWRKYGFKIWVLDLKTGVTVWRMPARAQAAGGGQ